MDDPQRIAITFHQIAWQHRSLAIARLVQDADATAYQRGLRRCGLAWLELMRRVAEDGLPFSSPVMRGSRWYPLTGAVAAGDFSMAARLTEHAPVTWDADREYEDDWLKYLAIVPLLRQVPGPELEALAVRWTEAQDGDTAGGPDLIAALLVEDRKAFTRAVRTMAEDHRRNVRAYNADGTGDPELVATESRLAVEAAAYAQIGRRAGLALSARIALVPDLALVAAPSAELPDDDWKHYDC